MDSLKSKVKQAFAVDPPGPCPPTDAQREAVEWLCLQVAKRHLTTPGLIALEMCRPLNWVAAQSMHAVAPGVWAIVKQATYENYQHLARYLENRGAVDWICQRIEEMEVDFTRKEQDHVADGGVADESHDDDRS